jgi:hypothetical protein
MKDSMLYLYCRGHVAARQVRDSLRRALLPPQPITEDGGMLVIHGNPDFGREAGLSKIAVTVILVAVGVGIAIAVAALLGGKIMDLARRTGEKIDSVPLDWGE